MRTDCGEASLVEAAVMGETRPPLGERGLCEGVEGRDRDFVEAGDNFEDCASAMDASGLCLLDMLSNTGGSIADSIPDRSSLVVEVLDIEYCLLVVGKSRKHQKGQPVRGTDTKIGGLR